MRGELTTAAYGQLMGAWLVVVMILFGAPLLAFSRPLRRLKEATVLAASAAATRRERAVERELLGSNMSAASDADARPPRATCRILPSSMPRPASSPPS